MTPGSGRVRQVPERLVGGDRHRRREVQAPGRGVVHHGDAKSVVGPLIGDEPVLEFGGSPRTLRAEDEVVTRRIGRCPEAGFRLGGEEPESLRCRGLEIAFPVVVFDHVEILPVVEPGATQRLLVHGEADRVDDVQSAAGREGGPADVPGVVGKVGTILGENKINIGAYLLSQHSHEKLAFAVIRLDRPIEDKLINKLQDVDELKFVNQIKIN